MIFRLINIESEYYLLGNHRPEIGDFIVEWQNPYSPEIEKITFEYVLAPDIQAPIIATTKTSVKFPLMEELPCIKVSQLMDLWVQNETIEDVAKKEFPVKIEARGGWGTEMDENEEIRNVAIKYYNKALTDNMGKNFTEDNVRRYHDVRCMEGFKKAEGYLHSITKKKNEWKVDVEMIWNPIGSVCPECGTGTQFGPCDNICKNQQLKLNNGYINILKFIE